MTAPRKMWVLQKISDPSMYIGPDGHPCFHRKLALELRSEAAAQKEWKKLREFRTSWQVVKEVV